MLHKQDRQIVIRVTFEKVIDNPTPEMYGGETDIHNMVEMEKQQLEGGAVVDFIMNEEPKIEVFALVSKGI